MPRALIAWWQPAGSDYPMDYRDPSNEIHRYGRDLPHWEQEESMQFVTFRLRDSLPASRVGQWKEERKIWMGHHPLPWTSGGGDGIPSALHVEA